MWSYQHIGFKVHQIPVLRDNYIYIIQDCHSDSVLVIDPALAQAVQQACEELNIKPTHILNTHHHWDHTDGNLELVSAYGCEVIGNTNDKKRIPGITAPIQDNQAFKLGSLNIQVLDVPGHTIGHIVFVIDDALFCGDTLFGAGCGRLFEGTHEQMWQSLQKLTPLPDQTKIYCAHEYTLTNLSFANEIDAKNKVLQKRILTDTKTRKDKRPTIPSTIGMEKKTNPFLRPLDSDFCLYFNQSNNQNLDALHIFKHLREQRNQW
ncbi:MAG: hydroxyacylglutathione hydrolase [Ghiorsea sp.]